MDPNQALEDLRRSLATLREVGEDSEDGVTAAVDAAHSAEALDGWLSRGGFLPWAWTPPVAGGNEPQSADKPALPLCAGCGLPLDTADDGTVFVYGTGTSADGLSFCPPDPDVETDDTHTFPAGYDDRAWQARQSGLDAL